MKENFCHSEKTNLVIPGNFLKILGQGVLLRGDSGTGKSTLSLELIHYGHQLVADDAVQLDLDKENSKILGRCPSPLQDFIYIRELGIINIQKMFGSSTICLETELKLVIELSTNIKQPISYLSDPYKTTSILNVQVPLLTIPAHVARPILIETAIRALSLKAKGYSALNEFHHKHQRAMNIPIDKNYDC